MKPALGALAWRILNLILELEAQGGSGQACQKAVTGSNCKSELPLRAADPLWRSGLVRKSQRPCLPSVRERPDAGPTIIKFVQGSRLLTPYIETVQYSSYLTKGVLLVIHRRLRGEPSISVVARDAGATAPPRTCGVPCCVCRSAGPVEICCCPTQLNRPSQSHAQRGAVPGAASFLRRASADESGGMCGCVRAAEEVTPAPLSTASRGHEREEQHLG